MAKQLTPQQVKFKKVAGVCKGVVSKNPTSNPLKAYGKCMKKYLRGSSHKSKKVSRKH